MPYSRLMPLLLMLSAVSGCAAPVVMGAAAAGAVVVAQDERSAATIAADEAIELNAAELARRDPPLAQSAHLNFTSINGIVLITGEAPASEPLAQLHAGLAKLDKVREVHNEAVVGPVSSISSRSQDSWITAKVKSRMVAEKNFRANRIKVVTEQQSVFLLGMVTKQEGFVAATIARDTEGVKRVVKMFEYLD